MEIKIQTEKLRQNKLLIATPMYGGIAGGLFTRSIADITALCTAHGIPLQYYFLFNESLIPRARNYCCDEFMRSDAQHMLFIDSDIGFNARDVIGLMALQAQENTEYDVIGGAYPKKNISWEKIKYAVDKGFADKNPNDLEKFVGDFVFNPKNGTGNIQISEPAEVLEIGTGFMMISKKAMLKFHEFYKHKYMYKPDHVRTEHFDGSRKIMMYFQSEIDRFYAEDYYANVLKDIRDGKVSPEMAAAASNDALEWAKAEDEKKSQRYLSEDYWFCQRAQDAGLKVWLCPWIKLAHQGSFVFGGSLADLAALGTSATADPSMLGKKKG